MNKLQLIELLRTDVEAFNKYRKDTKYEFINLESANLAGANLSGADLDYSELYLSCKSLHFKCDERFLRQLSYHLVSLLKYNDKKGWDLVGEANKSHLVKKHGLKKFRRFEDE